MKKIKLMMALPAITTIPLAFCNISVSCGSLDESSNYTIKKDVKIMDSDDDEGFKEIFKTDLLYKNGSSIAYISIKNGMNVVKKMHTFVSDEVWTTTLTKEGSNVVATRETGARCVFNPTNNTITLPDFVAFIAEGTSRVSCQIRDYGGFKHYKEDGVKFIAYGDTDVRVKTSPEKVFDLNAYNLHLITYKDEVYIPLQTLSDIFLADACQPIVALKDIIIPILAIPNERGDETYKPLPELIRNNALNVTPELLEFNYNELCFYLDNMYGLKDNKWITSFDTIFKSNSIDGKKSLKELMLSSAKGVDDAINWLIGYVFDDAHSKYVHRNPSNSDTTTFSYIEATWVKHLFSEQKRYIALRGDTFKSYAEVSSTTSGTNDTAIIRFDKFQGIPNEPEEAKPIDDPNKAKNTTQLFTSAYKKIANESSGIKNVVVDISCNGGGDVEFCVYLACMLSGGELNVGHMYTADTSFNVCSYYADANLDGKIDSNDFAFKDKNVYILTSPFSFSCGTLLPTWVFQKPNIKVIGKKTGGGACMVCPSTNALGTRYQISGTTQAGYIKNGIFYTNDSGIEPAFFVPDDVYYTNDGADLAKYIASHQK